MEEVPKYPPPAQAPCRRIPARCPRCGLKPRPGVTRCQGCGQDFLITVGRRG